MIGAKEASRRARQKRADDLAECPARARSQGMMRRATGRSVNGDGPLRE